jgi:formylglycine-generating enzyme required for sulfatase activity
MGNDYNGGKELRGGSWGDGNPEDLRASLRVRNGPSNGPHVIGFRCGV